MRVVAATDADRSRYNSFVSSSPLADVLQSWEWGEIKRISGWAPRRIIAEEDGRVVGAMQVLRVRPMRAAPPILYAPRGPVLDYGRAEVLTALLAEVRRTPAGGVMLKCDPPVEAGGAEARALRAAGLTPAGIGAFGGVQPRAVMVLDLDADEEKIFAGFKPKWRYNIRLAARKGVEIVDGTREDLGRFYALLVETAQRDKFFVRGRSYFEALFETLAPSSTLKLFLARYQGRAIAGAICFAFGPRATYVYGASSGADRNVMPNHLLQWHMIRWARAAGFRIYDFRGVSPVRDGRPVEEHIAGLNRFKEGFGARYVEYVGDLDLPLRPVAYRAWRLGAPLAMRLYKKLKAGAAD
jgi:lipid II:glycine glycyltransferase (peptidoglycan interpeptide bridge formation enzyme)